MREVKTKFYLETLILLLIKWTGMVEIKHKGFIDIVPNDVCSDIKLLTEPKLITKWYLLLIINYNVITIERLPTKTKIGKVS